MPRFCTKCGTPVASDDLRFCSQCGAPLSTPAAGPLPATAPPPPVPAPQAAGPSFAAPPPGPPPAPAKSGSSAAKIILILLGFFGVIGVLGIGSCAYLAYRVRSKAKEYHLDALMNQGGGKPVARRNVCTLATQEEVGEAFGLQVSDASGGDSQCHYTFSGGGNKSVEVEVTWEGGTIALKLTRAALKGVGGGMDVFQPVRGLGDEAYIAPMGAAVMFRKGDVMVSIDLRSVNNNAEAAKMVAQKIAARL